MPRTRPYREREKVLADALDGVERDAAERRERDQQQAVCSMECSHAYEVSTNLIPAALDEQCTGRAMVVLSLTGSYDTSGGACRGAMAWISGARLAA